MSFEPEPHDIFELERGGIRLRAWAEDWPLRKPFRIARTVFHHAKVIIVELDDGTASGTGEASGVDYKGETQASMLAQIAARAADMLPDVSRGKLQDLLPPGGARNALDCALWDLEAKRAGKRIWELCGISSPRPVHTYLTIGIDEPDEMARTASGLPQKARIKIKLGGPHDADCVRQIRKASPEAELIVDANQGWDMARLQAMMPVMQDAGVLMIEQPLPADGDEALRDFSSDIPICADEACQDVSDLPRVREKYQMINIKLDKTGGLTGALALADEGRKEGLGIMIGSNEPTSLGLAPAWIIAQTADIADLDGHWLNLHDRADGFGDSAHLAPFADTLWG